jgi:hypothetical protein
MSADRRSQTAATAESRITYVAPDSSMPLERSGTGGARRGPGRQLKAVSAGP